MREQKSNSGFKVRVTGVTTHVPADVQSFITHEKTSTPEQWFVENRSIFQLEWQRRLTDTDSVTTV